MVLYYVQVLSILSMMLYRNCIVYVYIYIYRDIDIDTDIDMNIEYRYHQKIMDYMGSVMG